MAEGFRTVRLSCAFVNTAALEAARMRRSAGGQIEHWAQIGRQFEALSTTTITRVKEVLAGTAAIGDLTQEDQRTAMEVAAERYTGSNAAIEGSYAALPKTAGATARRRLRARTDPL